MQGIIVKLTGVLIEDSKVKNFSCLTVGTCLCSTSFAMFDTIYADKDRLQGISLFGSQASSSKNQVAVWVSVSLCKQFCALKKLYSLLACFHVGINFS